MLKNTHFYLLVLTFFASIQPLHANILISPTHLTFADRQRSAKIVVINNGDTTRTYRIGWKELQAKPEGGYQPISERDIASFNIASAMLRYSPKQVTLKAGERQTIKMALRRPKNMADGEYRSHLLLTALPTKNENENSGTIKLKMLMSYTLPVIVRQGKDQQPKVTIAVSSLTYQADRQSASIKVSFSRQGLYSTHGNILAYWTPKSDGTEKIVAQLNGYNIYHELNNTHTNITWPNFKPEAGTLRLVYLGKKQYSGKVLAEKTIQVTPKMFHKLNK